MLDLEGTYTINIRNYDYMGNNRKIDAVLCINAEGSYGLYFTTSLNGNQTGIFVNLNQAIQKFTKDGKL